LEFKSTLAGDSIRGSSVDFLICTESAFMPREVVEQVLLPMLNVKGKKALFESTPRGRNWFWEYYMKGKDRIENPEFACVKFTYVDNPLSNLKLISTIKKNIPFKVFQQEYLAEFVDGGAVFNNIDRLMTGEVISKPVAGHKYFVGIDIGLITDRTVITVINQLGQVVLIDKFTELESPQVKERIKAVVQTFKPVKTYIERNGIGLAICQDLKPEIPSLEAILTTNQSKEVRISQLINACESNFITLPKDADDLKNEMDSFGFSFTKTGKISYQSITGHDDMVMSLAFAYDCFLKNKRGRNLIIRTG